MYRFAHAATRVTADCFAASVTEARLYGSTRLQTYFSIVANRARVARLPLRELAGTKAELSSLVVGPGDTVQAS